MELFGFHLSLFALIAIYILGAFAVGFPVGKLTLRAWKNPSKYHFVILKILFPLSDSGDVGTLYCDCEGGNNLPPTMSTDVHHALQSGEDRLPLAKYLIAQMVLWPLRVAYTIVAGCITFVCHHAVNMPTYGGKILMRCGKCLEI